MLNLEDFLELVAVFRYKIYVLMNVIEYLLSKKFRLLFLIYVGNLYANICSQIMPLLFINTLGK